MGETDRHLQIAPGVTVPEAELTIRFTRSSGPGGQNVNKRATRAEVTFNLIDSPSIPPALKRRARRRLANRLDARGRIRVVSQAERTQAANRDVALRRLQELLRAAVAPPPKARTPTKPSRAAKRRRLDDKRRHGQKKKRRAAPADDD